MQTLGLLSDQARQVEPEWAGRHKKAAHAARWLALALVAVSTLGWCGLKLSHISREITPPPRWPSRPQVVDKPAEEGRDKQLLEGVRVLHQPSAQVSCGGGGAGGELLIVVNSRAANEARRRRLRQLWLNELSLRRQVCGGGLFGRVRYLFVMGVESAVDEQQQQQQMMTTNASRAGEEPSKEHLVLNLEENYKAMTIKHLATLSWIAGAASQDTILLKCDDDAHVEHLSALLERALKVAARTSERDRWLVCAQFEALTEVQRAPEGDAKGTKTNKWQVSRQEWPADYYPAYCSGLAYLAPVSLASDLLAAAEELQWDATSNTFRRPLWIDDVYVTGVLVEWLARGRGVSVKVERANGLFCYSETARRWRISLARPCQVTELDHG